MARWLAGVVLFSFIVPALASAVSGNRLAQNEGSSSGSVQAANPGPVQPTNMSQVAVGDHWTYELKDEITGEVF
jgi:hypothetical protein